MPSSSSNLQSGELCILASVYYKYTALARLTHERIRRYWENPPPTFFCGVTPSEAPGHPAFPLERAPTDFMAILHDAVCALSDLGYEKCYLILEEQMPLGPCHSRHLNETLPALMDELGASYIGLWGWDQKRHPARGPILDRQHYRLQKLPVEFDAKFSLHPGLWRLDVLKGLLESLLRTPGLPAHTPWRFERGGGHPHADIPLSWKSSCYRVCGAAMSLTPPSIARKLLSPLSRFFFDKLRALQFHFPNASIRNWLWEAGGFDAIFFNGPYPLYFGGLMTRGKPNRHLLRFLEKRQEHSLVAQILAAAPNPDLQPRVPVSLELAETASQT